MNSDDFRRIALGMKDAIESAHMGHPDFRINGKIFATLHGDLQTGMVKLTPEQQRRFVHEEPAVFVPEKGSWGLQGCTAVRLETAREEAVGEALTLASHNVAERAQGVKKKRPRKV
jgi:hypothetical protein